MTLLWRPTSSRCSTQPLSLQTASLMYDSVHRFAHGQPQELLGSSTCDMDLERAVGAGRVVFAGSASGTKIAYIHQKFPIALAFPTIDDRRSQEAVIINCSGGIAGGDHLQIEVVAESDASVVVTTQAAEKVYRALDRPAQIVTRLRVHENAKLAWLPQETIIFDKARIKRHTEVDLCSGAEILALEWLVLGRTESGEQVCSGYILDSWRIKLDDRLVWADGFLVSDEVFPHLHREALLSNWRAVGTLIYYGPRLDTRLEILREIATSLDCKCAATMVGTIIVIRVAAIAGADLKRGLRRLLDQFGQEFSSGPIGIPKMWSC